MREITFVEALLEAFREEMRRDGTVFHLCGGLGPLQDLVPEFGARRVRVCPISEDAYVGAGIGAAGCGFRPIISPGLMAFAFTAMDQIVNQMAKVHYMFGGQAQFPLVLRASTGGGRAAAAQHCQSSHPFFLNLPGLKVVMPSTPSDAKGLMKTSIRDNNPVVFFEPQGYSLAGLTGPVPEDDYTIPIGAADVKRPGSDATIVAIGHMVQESLSAAAVLEEQHGVSAEVVDPRTLVPLDRTTLEESVIRTGRLVVVDEASSTGSAAAEIIAAVTESAAFSALRVPPRRLCAPDVPIPYSPAMEQHCVPRSGDVVAAVLELVRG